MSTTVTANVAALYEVRLYKNSAQFAECYAEALGHMSAASSALAPVKFAQRLEAEAAS